MEEEVIILKSLKEVYVLRGGKFPKVRDYLRFVVFV